VQRASNPDGAPERPEPEEHDMNHHPHHHVERMAHAHHDQLLADAARRRLGESVPTPVTTPAASRTASRRRARRVAIPAAFAAAALVTTGTVVAMTADITDEPAPVEHRDSISVDRFRSAAWLHLVR
jgi:hypothetical protein